MHATLVSMYTVVSFVSFNIVLSGKNQYKFYTAVTLAGGVLDIFISCMIWFILDEETAPSIIRDEKNKISYHVLDVVQRNESGEALMEAI